MTFSERYAANPEYYKRKAKEYREKRRAAGLCPQGDNIDKIRATRREKKRLARITAQPWEKRPARHDAHIKLWKSINKPERIIKHDAHVKCCFEDRARYQFLYCRRRPQGMIYGRLKRWMNKHLQTGMDSEKWSDILGYSVDDLRRHLERQFKQGMDWSNRDKWHIDHIIPVASFSFSSWEDEDFKRCYALSNLRPMWAKDNLKKNAKVLTLL